MTAIALIWTLPLMFWWMYSVMNWSQDLARLANDESSQAALQVDFLSIFLPFLVYYCVSLVLGLLLSYLYFVEYQIRKGQTVGKRVMKLKIIPADPAAVISRSHLVKRWAIERVIATFVPLFGWLNGLWQLWDKPLQQCLHDKAAGTVVVKAG